MAEHRWRTLGPRGATACDIHDLALEVPSTRLVGSARCKKIGHDTLHASPCAARGARSVPAVVSQHMKMFVGMFGSIGRAAAGTSRRGISCTALEARLALAAPAVSICRQERIVLEHSILSLPRTYETQRMFCNEYSIV